MPGALYHSNGAYFGHQSRRFVDPE